MSGTDPHRNGGSRAAGYIVATLLGAPALFLVAAVLLGNPRLAIAVGVTAGAIGLTIAARASSEERASRLPD